MRDFRSAMSRLKALRDKFDGLLQVARAKPNQSPKAAAAGPAPLREIAAFGTNPGELRMLAYCPADLPRRAPLVVALHGCNQTAEEYSRGCGWSSLADRFGFAVVYPQQQPANNAKNCFSWFLPGDTARGHGEALSIAQMVEHASAAFGSDRRRIFVTGLSAGGAMAAVMLATYPDVFAGGAIIAGLPYGCARSAQQAFEAMFTEQSHPAPALGDRVRAASKHRGPWPKISIWHGTADPIVKPSNADEIVRQWVDVHGLPVEPSYVERIGSHTRRVWTDADGEPVIESFWIDGMAHGVPLASPLDGDGCGAPGPFFLDAGISSTQHIANFWHLSEGAAERPRAAATVPAPQPRQMQADGRALAMTDAAAGDWSDSAAAPHGESTAPGAGGALDPNAIIAAAFRAAGLPVPDLPKSPPSATTPVATGPIIAAALKAAGLRRL
jgi:feruloyl esterase